MLPVKGTVDVKMVVKAQDCLPSCKLGMSELLIKKNFREKFQR